MSDPLTLELLKGLSDLGLPALVFFVLYAGFKQWWVWGWQYREIQAQNQKIQAQCDYWRSMSLRLMHVAEKSVEQIPHPPVVTP